MWNEFSFGCRFIVIDPGAALFTADGNEIRLFHCNKKFVKRG